MSPDINSLPPSRSASASPRQRRTLSSLLDALAPTQPLPVSSAGSSNPTHNNNNNHYYNSSTTITDLPRRHHPITMSERRRSGNLNLNSSNNSYSESGGVDIPSPSDHRPSNLGGSPVIGTGDPHHQRTPSLGELHQELEQEQEAQVNRLLQTIRSQQVRLQHLEQQHQQSAIDDTPLTSERPTSSLPPAAALSTAGSRTSTQLTSSLSSRRPSQAYSPNLRPADLSRGPDASEWVPGPGESAGRRGSRDESSFYHAEATALARENQMLRQRVRELERQVSELNTALMTSSQTPDEPNVGAPQVAAGAESDGEASDKT
ncbi:hypothetical protein ASPSYDRAFT_58158 [Aspergillus sydowii CBS 593.65]|uniref:BZIP domain-containing protein n=1 Tax=Aspergillus sydowii CBS 593.65 TaxID=1036612 RepID=A0A1L9THT2_9EURO|nr:uncharacterized protein ASPSYDRAFT_58158 [Aspergillus sydowii CBS 593.65]OJJ58965.1 hypothetical protein ASPSYDRAFT_58158 [Aspergillus sydowii CBS 593.65]